jgi:hypothetical protein
MIQTNTLIYKNHYEAFHNAVKQWTNKNGKAALIKAWPQILQQAQTKFGLIIRNGKIVAPTPQPQRPTRPQHKPTQRPAKHTTAKPSKPTKPFWM